MKLTVSSSPHLHAQLSTSRVMRDVLIALSPAVVAACVLFGWRAPVLIVFCTALSMGLEWLSRLVMKRENTLRDGSAAVTGVLLALTLPADVPLQLAAVGCIVAIVVVKQMFGGLGNNFVNPALTARVVMLVSFPTELSSVSPTVFADAVTTATPLSATADMANFDLLDLFLGNVGGAIGETCKLAILIGFVYLLVRRVISPVIPLAMVGTVALFSLAVGADPLFQILSGGLLLGAVFMATDYVTSPFSTLGQLIYAVGCGLLTVLIRLYANLPEGVSYAILLMNILTPLIDRVTRPRVFGAKRRGASK